MLLRSILKEKIGHTIYLILKTVCRATRFKMKRLKCAHLPQCFQKALSFCHSSNKKRALSSLMFLYPACQEAKALWRVPVPLSRARAHHSLSVQRRNFQRSRSALLLVNILARGSCAQTVRQ